MKISTIKMLFAILAGAGIMYLSNSLPSIAEDTTPKLHLGDPLPANLFTEIARIATPTVVNISTTQLPHQIQGMPPFGGNDPFFNMLQPFMVPQQAQPLHALGTGFIIRKDGLILTNNHVIDQADIIKVQLSEKDKKLYEAEVVGKDQRTDIALIKIKSNKTLPVAKLGSSKDVRVGEWVAAVGNPFGHGHTLTKGIISAVGREIDELNRFPFLQTDASINPGNSGGPLINSKGEVIGVNAAIDARAQGIGFAIPIDNVKSILKTLETEGRIKRAFLGVSLANVRDPRLLGALGLKNNKGALIEQVYEGSPAAKFGLKPYDFITKIGTSEIEDADDLSRAIADHQVGEKIDVILTREGKEKTIKVTLAESPQEKTRFVKKHTKTYQGQKAPFDLGFKVSDLNSTLRKDFHLSNISGHPPIVIEISPDSPASQSGLAPGDVILDVNRIPIKSSRDLLKGLNQKFNTLRVLRGGSRAIILYIKNF